MGKISKAKGCLGGMLLGSALRVLIYIVNGLIKLIVAVMVFFGLWAPFFYALLGAALYLTLKFDPFSGSVDSKLYLAGFAGSLLCALLLTIRHIFDHPAKSVAEGFRNPVWKKPEDEEEGRRRENEDEGRSRRRERENEDSHYERRGGEESYRRRYYAEEERERAPERQRTAYESPRIYYSALEKDTIVHEYADRFEVFRIRDGRPVLDKVEYKNI